MLLCCSGGLSLIQYNLQADLFINDELTEKYNILHIWLQYIYIIIIGIIIHDGIIMCYIMIYMYNIGTCT